MVRTIKGASLVTHLGSQRYTLVLQFRSGNRGDYILSKVLTMTEAEMTRFLPTSICMLKVLYLRWIIFYSPETQGAWPKMVPFCSLRTLSARKILPGICTCHDIRPERVELATLMIEVTHVLRSLDFYPILSIPRGLGRCPRGLLERGCSRLQLASTT